MKITVTAEQPQDNKMTAEVTVPAKDVTAAVAKSYKDISHKYSFQGFRKGHTPRPVIDGIVGREAVLADATNAVINELEPLMLEELDVVPVDEVDFGKEPTLVVEDEDYVIVATINLRPTCELEGYDAPEINMPPDEVTEAEIDEQIDVLQGYHTTYEDIEEDRPVAKDDIVQADVENVDGAEGFAGENRMFTVGQGAFPEEFDDQVIGMKKGETKEVSFTPAAPEADQKDEADDAEKPEAPKPIVCKVTVNSIKKKVVPELDDEFVKKAYGFDSMAELRDAVKSEIEGDKKSSFPGMKEDRVVDALAKRLTLDKVPENYLNQVYQELAQEFLNQLQRQGMTLDMFLNARHIAIEDFMNDLHAQAEERARQSLALDALARELELEATQEDIDNEFKNAGSDDVQASIKQFMDSGRMPAIRESIKRTKAVDWLLENAKVDFVDEVAERREAEGKPITQPAEDEPTEAPADDAPAEGETKTETDAE